MNTVPEDLNIRSVQLPQNLLVQKRVVPEDIDSSEPIKLLSNAIEDQIQIDQIRSRLNSSLFEQGSSSFFNSLKQENHSIDLRILSKIGHGGTHEVYMYERDRSYVIKINRALVDRVQKMDNKTYGDLLNAAQTYVVSQKQRYGDLYLFMGSDNCLKEIPFVSNVVVENGRSIPTVVSVQESSDVFSKEHVDFNCANLDQLLSLSKRDSGFKTMLQELLLRILKYQEQTGRFIDLIGEKNVLLFREKEQWHFQVGSVVKGDTIAGFEAARSKKEQGVALNIEENTNLLNGERISTFLEALKSAVL